MEKTTIENYFHRNFILFYSKYLENIKAIGKNTMAVCPFHADHSPSLSINNETGLFNCFGCGAAGSIFDFYARIRGLNTRSDFPRIIEEIAETFEITNGGQSKKTMVVARYNYLDEFGHLQYQIERKEPKHFGIRRPSGNGGWIYDKGDVCLLPYQLPAIQKSSEVIVVEGEKDADNLIELGFTATTNPFGAGKWPDHFGPYFTGKDVFLIPDNDDPGRQHMDKVAANLRPYAESIKFLGLPDQPEKGDVSDFITRFPDKAEAAEQLAILIDGAAPYEPLENPLSTCDDPESAPYLDNTSKQEGTHYGYMPKKNTESKDTDQWDCAAELFPRRPFPWDVFPSAIAESLKQVARSCATSDVSMPGAAMAIMASAVGRTMVVSPKISWQEPSIMWVADIRPSGEGKTPQVRALLGPVYEAQRRTDERYQADQEQWESMPKRSRGAAPKRPAAHFATDLTLEGLRMDVTQGHGGMVCVLDELSSMISAQNSYKQKGNDREAWLTLWESKPARITRASGALTISGACISMFGGIQPAVFKKVFGGDNGIYCVDGTIFRFLFTFEKESIFLLTNEAWSEGNRRVWESTLENAIAWSEGIVSVNGWKPCVMHLTEGAQKLFYDYRNEIYSFKNLLPELFRGFIPKAISYVLRIAGVLHCIRHFTNGLTPGKVLFEEDIAQAITVIDFYLSNTVSALRLISTDCNPATINVATHTLAHTLASLRNDLDSGRLAVGYVFEKFNAQCEPAPRIKSEKAMGTLLREHGLTVPSGKYNANGRRGVCCMAWDDQADRFVRTWRTSTDQSPHRQTIDSTGLADIADLADIAGEEYDIEGTAV